MIVPGLIIAMAVFSFIAVGLLFRGLMNITVVAGGFAVPAWLSIIVGFLALFMAVWIGNVYRHVRDYN